MNIVESFKTIDIKDGSQHTNRAAYASIEIAQINRESREER